MKLTASTGFLITALFAGALDSNYGKFMLLGLVFSWFGDMFLGLSIPNAFLLGLTAFLLGHLSYSAAFLFHGVSPKMTGIGAVALVLPVLMIFGWLWPSMNPGDPKLPVACYLAVITVMMMLAIGTWEHDSGIWIITGAALFYMSDIFVARSAFVESDPLNSKIGLPLYFAGQVVLAMSIYPANDE
jgi:uncharacterized membrane protein YhhN